VVSVSRGCLVGWTRAIGSGFDIVELADENAVVGWCPRIELSGRRGALDEDEAKFGGRE
jgi:hypothetical protein